MGFRRISTFHFRNLSNQEISLDARDICFIGENGQGKTNILETVYLLCFGTSFRTKNERELVRNGESAFSLSGGIATESGEQTVQVKSVKGKKEIFVDERRIRDRKEIITNMPCIVFAHDDFFFVSGPPEKKRWFFNQTLSLYDPFFIDSLRQYRKIVKARNIVLKENRLEEIEVLSFQLAQVGIVICQKRAELIEQFNVTFSPLFKRISESFDLEIRYVPSWKTYESDKDAAGILEKSRSRDLEFGMTTTGPHRDTFAFLHRGKEFTRKASTGQIRLISLVLRVAQAAFFKAMTGKKPLLLLDDVLLELDQGKRRAFFESLPEYDQALFTFLSYADIDYIGKGDVQCDPLVYTVREGTVEEWKKRETF